jgi:hypothetical protein
VTVEVALPKVLVNTWLVDAPAGAAARSQAATAQRLTAALVGLRI